MFASANVNAPPTVSAGGPYTATEGSSVVLNASGSDPEGGALSYAWHLNADGTFETAGASATFSAASIDGPSTRTVSVQGTDPGGLTATATATVTIVNAPPAVTPIALPSGPFLVGASITPVATFTDAGIADSHTASWSWGDGSSSAGSVSESGGSGSTSATHAYSGPGTYTIAVTVTDDDGGVGTSQISRTIVYNLCLLYDPLRPVPAGSTIPIRLQLCTAGGDNLSSPDVVLTVTGSFAGEAFRYDPTLGGTGGYILNLSTKGLTPGDYEVTFTAGAEPYVYKARFRVRSLTVQ